MPLDPMIAQGITPIGADIPNVLMNIQKMKAAEQENALRQLQMQHTQMQMQADQNALNDAQGLRALRGNPNANLSDYAKFGTPGLQEYGAGQSAAVADQGNRDRAGFQIASMIESVADKGPEAVLNVARAVWPQMQTLSPNLAGKNPEDIGPTAILQGATAIKARYQSFVASDPAVQAKLLESQYTGAPVSVMTPDGPRYVRPNQAVGLEPAKPESIEPKAVLVNGKPTYVRASEAIGKTPYTPSLFGAGQMTGDAIDQVVDTYLTTGQMPTGFSRNPAMQAQIWNRVAQKAGPNSAAGIVANRQATVAAQGVLKDYTSGATSKTLNGLNTAISHMDTLDQAASALGNGDTQALNRISNSLSTQFGKTAVVNFDTVKNFAAGEVAKAVLPSGGGEAERQAIADAIKSSSSPQQLHQAIQQWRELLAGKTDALRNQWDVGTGGRHGDFEKFLLPATKRALGIGNTPSAQPDAAHPPAVQVLLDKYK